jgi:hypothetical protein
MQVLRSSAGWYVGFLDQDASPYSRETHYFLDEASAALALELIEIALRRHAPALQELPFIRS